jgi:CubicO group peptidase (beta-lactamase class C family)
MQLVDEGKLNLDQPISKYLKKWHLPDTQYDESKVTLRTLMSHTSGVTDSTEYGYTLPLPNIAQALKERKIQLKREPGTVFEYSSFAGFGICQLIVEEVTGQSFENYMQKEVFQKLNMPATSYSSSYESPYTMATPYAGLGKPVNIIPIVMNGAGGVSATSSDLANFVIGLMKYYDSSNKIMFSPQKNTKTDYGEYGLGIVPCKLENGKTIFEHNGTLTGWNAQIAFEPVSKDGIIVLTNTDKAFYFAYDVMKVWSNQIAGETVLDSKMMVEQTENMVNVGIAVLGIVLLLFFSFFIYRLYNKQLRLINKRKSIITSIIFICFLLLIMGTWYIALYSDIPVQVLDNIPDYYLFTFFTPNFKYINWVLSGLLMTITIRLFFRKNRIKTN